MYIKKSYKKKKLWQNLNRSLRCVIFLDIVCDAPWDGADYIHFFIINMQKILERFIMIGEAVSIHFKPKMSNERNGN